MSITTTEARVLAGFGIFLPDHRSDLVNEAKALAARAVRTSEAVVAARGELAAAIKAMRFARGSMDALLDDVTHNEIGQNVVLSTRSWSAEAMATRYADAVLSLHLVQDRVLNLRAQAKDQGFSVID